MRCRPFAMTDAERRWLRANRSALAARWRVLSRLEPEITANASN